MSEVTTIGIDIAKQVFQLHGVGEAGEVMLCRRLRRSQVVTRFTALPPCLVGIEACSTAHFWAREIAAFGHDVRPMPTQPSGYCDGDPATHSAPVYVEKLGPGCPLG